MTGKPVSNPAEVALDTSIIMAHRGRTAEIPFLTKERSQKTALDITCSAHSCAPEVDHDRIRSLLIIYNHYKERRTPITLYSRPL